MKRIISAFLLVFVMLSVNYSDAAYAGISAIKQFKDDDFMRTHLTSKQNTNIFLTDMEVNNLSEPLGVDQTPFFSWVINGGERADYQTHYRIIVGSTPDKVQSLNGDIWDSGRVSSDISTGVLYGGGDLTSRTTYYWTVIVESNSGKQVIGDVQRFTTGFLDESEWQGDWIGGKKLELDLEGAKWIWRTDSGSGVVGTAKGKQYFRKSITPELGRTVSEVLIAFTADDESSLYVNGTKVANSNSWSDGIVYDATAVFTSGTNVVAIEATNSSEGFAGMISKIKISYTDGSSNTIISDTSWKVYKILRPGWTGVEFNDSTWLNPDQNVDYGTGPWESNVNIRTTNGFAAVLLRKEFQVTKPVKEAYAYVCGLGFFEFSINGELADQTVLNPYTSQYNKTVLYRTFDIKDFLSQGDNAFGVELGNSFYNEASGVWNWQNAAWRDDPKLMFNAIIVYEDGTTQEINSDTSWKYTKDGPITLNSIYYGEDYDANKVQTGFNQAGFDDTKWHNSVLAIIPEGTLKSHLKVPYERVKSIEPIDVTKLDNGSYIIEFSETVGGWARLRGISEPKNAKLTITYGQKLNRNGTVVKWGGGDGENGHWWPNAYLQEDHYISDGIANSAYEPKFSIKGFNYIQLDGWTGELTKENVTAYRIANGIEQVSEFDSSNDMFNKIHTMMVNSLANNHMGEHCEPLIERNGWTGDINVSLGSLMYNYDMTGALVEFIKTMEDAYDYMGYVPVIAPSANWTLDSGNSPVWSSLFVYGVQSLQSFYGQQIFTENQYDIMKKYTNQLSDAIKDNGWVWMDTYLGDWVSPIGGSNPNLNHVEGSSEGSAIVGTAYVYGVMDYMAALADSMGKADDAIKFRADMSNIYQAFNREFFKADKGYYQTNYWSQIGTRTRYRQTSNIAPLIFGLVPDEHVKSVLESIVQDIIDKDYHLDTGMVGTRYILPLLSDYGYSEVAYKVANRRTYPSWGYLVDYGAKSTWETWENTSRSVDHYFLGTLDEWLFSHLGGIRDIKDGYKSFVIKPEYTTKNNEGISWVDVSVKTVRGVAAVRWGYENDSTISVNVKIPFGSSSKVYLPAKDINAVTLDGTVLTEASDGVKSIDIDGNYLVVEVGSGEYTFQVLPNIGSKASLIDSYYNLKNLAYNGENLNYDNRQSYTTLMNRAKSILYADSFDSDELMTVSNELSLLKNKLEHNESRKKLSTIIDKAEGMRVDKNAYTARDYAMFNTAFTTAKKVLGDYRQSDARINAAANALEEAIAYVQGKNIGNIALGKNVTASSSAEDKYWNWSIEHINDGDRKHDSNGQYAGYSSINDLTKDHIEWVQIDFGSIASFNNLTVYPAAYNSGEGMIAYGFPKALEIQVSSNQTTWTTVYSKGNLPLPEYGAQSFDFGQTSGRYVRFVATSLRRIPQDNNYYRLQLAEIEVYLKTVEEAFVPELTYLEVGGALSSPVFGFGVYEYTAYIPRDLNKFLIIPYAEEDHTVKVNGAEVIAGEANYITLENSRQNIITVTVSDGVNENTYQVYVVRTGNLVDKGVLESLIHEARSVDLSIYTKASADKLESATKAAEDVLSKFETTQEEVDQVLNNLKKAMQGLKEPANLSVVLPIVSAGVVTAGGGTVTTLEILKRKKTGKSAENK